MMVSSLLNDGQCGSYGSYASDEVLGLIVVCPSDSHQALQQLVVFLYLDAVCWPTKNKAEAYVTHKEGLASSAVVGSDSNQCRTGTAAPR